MNFTEWGRIKFGIMKTKLLWMGKLLKARFPASPTKAVAYGEHGIYAASPNCLSTGSNSFEHRRSVGHRSGMNAALRWRYQATVLITLVILLGAGLAAGGTNEVRALLQKGLFEEDANRNLDAAIQAYQSVITQTDKNHQFAATAIFRLGECYRKQGKTNEANAQYQRILREFPDQAELVKLSREYAGNSVASSVSNQTGSPDVFLKLQQQLADAKAEIDSYQRQIGELEAMEPEKRRVFAQQHYPNPVLESLMQDAVKTEQELAKKKSDLGNNHPDVQRATAVLKTIYQQIDAQIDGIVAGLAEKRNVASVTVDLLEKRIKEEAKSNTAGTAAAAQEVAVAPSEAEEIKRLQTMIKDSPDLINGSDGGSSPLNSAARNGQLTVAKFLLDNKADTEVVDNFANTPLLLAARHGRKEMVELLLERGASVNATVSKEKVAKNSGLNSGENGRTSLHFAAFYGHKVVAETLLAHGAKVDARDAEGKTPLHYAAQKEFKNVVEMLLTAGADVNAKDNNGATALFEAVGAGNKAIAELLLARGAAVNERNDEGKSALFSAVTAGNKPIVELLLANKSDVNLKTKDGLTPLIAAVNARQLEITRLLLKHGADAKAKMADNHQSTSRWTALDAAVSLNENELVKLLLDYQADPNATYDLNDGWHQNSTPLIMAAENGLNETAQILLAHKADVNSKTAKEITALLQAVSRDHREMAALLLDSKADTEIKYNNIGHPGGTVLHYTAEHGKKEMAELLLAHGAQVNARDDEGRTALHLAVSGGSSPMVELLLAHEADVNLKDNRGNTALDLAGNQSGAGNVFNVVGGGSQPLNYQWQFNGTPGSSGPSNDINALLRQHGAISALERGTIRITRDGQQAQGVVFRQDAHAYNHHTLFEVIAYTYPHQLGLAYLSPTFHRDRDPELPGFYFPDFAHVRIHRLEANARTNILSVDLEAALNSGDCSKNQALNWGDIVELPELDHNVSENWGGLAQPIRDTLKKCLERQVEIIVKGKVTKVALTPNSHPGGKSFSLSNLLSIDGSNPVPAADTGAKIELPFFWLSDVVRSAKVLLASSDLTGVKVRRADLTTGKSEWLDFNLKRIDEYQDEHSDLWLQDGDVIEVPEKQ